MPVCKFLPLFPLGLWAFRLLFISLLFFFSSFRHRDAGQLFRIFVQLTFWCLFVLFFVLSHLNSYKRFAWFKKNSPGSCFRFKFYCASLVKTVAVFLEKISFFAVKKVELQFDIEIKTKRTSLSTKVHSFLYSTPKTVLFFTSLNVY